MLLDMHVWIECFSQRRSSPLGTLHAIMLKAGYCVAVGLEYECAWCHLVPQWGVTGALRLEMFSADMHYMLPQHCAIGLH